MTQLEQMRQARIDDATARQMRAADVAQSVWVSASAGTGKTHVLTSRIVNMLLQDVTLLPDHILAVTFTKAAAREMDERIREKLAAWYGMEDETLIHELTPLLGKAPTAAQCMRARTLFPYVLDHPVQVSTIHGLCQSLLTKFPLEAEMPPTFKVVEEQEVQALLKEAQKQVIIAAGEAEESDAFRYFAGLYSERELDEALAAFIYNHRRFMRLFADYGGLQPTLYAVRTALSLPDEIYDDHRAYQQTLLAPNEAWQTRLHALAQGMGQGGATCQKGATVLAQFHQTLGAERLDMWDAYAQVFYTAGGELRKSILDKKAAEAGGAALEQALHEEIQHVMHVRESVNAMRTYLVTAAYLKLGSDVLAVFQALKDKRGVVDFDDLIHHVLMLLEDEEKSAWVRFKMDKDIRHILLDEAQDTDEAQWGIVKALLSEFFVGQGQHEGEAQRTFFAVGDFKQSIYRFRGAQPDVFHAMRQVLEEAQQVSGHRMHVEEMMTSFRSAPAVLNVVDQVFADQTRKAYVDDQAANIEHASEKLSSGGRVEVWPLTIAPEDEAEEAEPWGLPTRREAVPTAKMTHARRVAAHIQTLLSSQTLITTTKQPHYVGPDDVMILLRDRGLLPEMIRALDEYNIPHTGADRITLVDDPVVQDVLALLAFLACPDDDVSLAQALRSPLFNVNDDTLFDVCHGRTGTVWQRLYAHTSCRDIKDVLESLLHAVGYQGVYPLVCEALQKTQARGAFVGRMGAAGVAQKVDAALDALLDMAYRWDYQEKGGLHAFVHDLKGNADVLKQELSASAGRVRLITAHGAKGLEAPVVYMPDAHSGFFKNLPREKHMWQRDEEGRDNLFLYRMNKEKSTHLQHHLEEAEKEAIRQDEMRLLYVALTRAKEHAYISGVRMARGANSGDTWHQHMLDAIEKHEEQGWAQEGETWVHAQAPQAVFTPITQSVAHESVERAPPTWMSTLAGDEKGMVIHRASERLDTDGEEEETLTLAKTGDVFQRGRAIHRLLEVLPNSAPHQRVAQGERFLAHALPHVTEETRTKLVQNVLDVMAQWPALFGENSRAEVPLAAPYKQGRLEGVVDRLVVEETRITILDYKTNKDVPDTLPEAYQKQLKKYVKAIQHIEPQKEVRAGVVWTSAMPLKIEWLDVG